MRRYRNTKIKSKNFNFIKDHAAIIFLVIAVVVVMIIINASLKPVIMDMAKQYGSAAVASAINEAVTDTFSEDNVAYSDIVVLSYNDSGSVSAVEYDSAGINQLKVRLANNLNTKLNKLKSSKIKIPIGSLFGDLNTSGQGPNISVKISQVSVPTIDIISSFESVGINTVKHEIIARITVNSEVYLPPKKDEFSYSQDYVIAQTIIVGSIPSGYVGIS